MKSVECLVVGYDQVVQQDSKKVSFQIPFCRVLERLRNESRSGTIVAVRIVEPVRVELDLAVVEVEDRGVIEADIGIRRIVPTHPCHQS